jgi:hypothetical protein
VQLISRLPDDSTATLVAADLLEQTSALGMAAYYAELLRRGQPPRLLGDKAIDMNQLSKMFDARLEKELFSLKNDIFNEHQPDVRALVHGYSDKTKLWDFLTKAAGESASNWAKVIKIYMNSWQHSPTTVDVDEISAVPHGVLKQAFEVFKKADITLLPTHEREAATIFMQWFSQSNISSA